MIQSESEKVLDPRAALYAVLLFHTCADWTPQARAEWRDITGSDEATTKTLCDHVRNVLADGLVTDTIEESQAKTIDVMRKMLDQQAVIIDGLATTLDSILERLPEHMQALPNVIRARSACKKAIEMAAKHAEARKANGQ